MYVLEVSDMSGYGAGGPMGPYPSEVWTPVPGLLEFTVTRNGPARPGTLEAVYAAQDIMCGSPIHARQRFRLRDSAVTDLQNRDIIMVGRLDDVEPVQDARYGRVYRVKGRDYLGALADNHVDKGVDWKSYYTSGIWPAAWTPNWVGFDNMMFDPFGASYGAGEIRGLIVSQLALNVLDGTVGLRWVTMYPGSWPNSKPVEMNFESTTGYTILDAIRNVARDDPWSDTPVLIARPRVDGLPVCPPPPGSSYICTTTAVVDSYDIVTANGGAGWPDAGIGGEFQIDYYSAGQGPMVIGDRVADQRNGHYAAYFRRGANAWDPSIVFQYGAVQLTGAKAVAIPIISYDLPELGSDIYSRSQPVGTGSAQYQTPAPAGSTGTGKVLQSVEDTWDPVNGQYASRRDIVNYDEALTGDWIHEMLPDSGNFLSRALSDRAYSDLYTGNATLARYRGAVAGSITVPYFLRNIAGIPLMPGQTILLRIDHLGILKNMIADSWSYSWPANQMTVQITRNPMRSFGQQVISGVRKAEQLVALTANTWDSGWWLTDGTGSHRWTHNKGVLAKDISVQVALPSGYNDALGRPVPLPGTEQAFPGGLQFDPTKGQWAGTYSLAFTKTDVTVTYSFNVAYGGSPDAGSWMLDGTCLLKVIVKG